MKKFFLLLVCIVVGVTFLLPAHLKVVKSYALSNNQTDSVSIFSFNGQVDIQGNLEGSVIMIGGKLHLNGTINEDVMCIGSDVVIDNKTVIKGDLMLLGGMLNKNEIAKVNGEFLYLRFDMKKIESSILPFLSDANTLMIIKLIKIITWFIIALIVFGIFPQKVNTAKEIIEKNLFKIGSIGLISLFCFLLLFILLILLSFFLIGIPLLIILIIIYIVLFIFGRTVFLLYLGTKVSSLIGFKKVFPVIYIIIGIFIYSLLKFIPVAGIVILLIFNLFEIGVGVGYLFRKKMKLVS